MKKYLFLLIVLFFLSCEDFDHTGHLLGQWQVTSINEDGDILAQPNDLFLSFQGELFTVKVLRPREHVSTTLRGVFREKQDSLLLSFYIEKPEDEKTIQETLFMQGDPVQLKFGVQENSSHLVLTSQKRIWKLRKY